VARVRGVCLDVRGVEIIHALIVPDIPLHRRATERTFLTRFLAQLH
jgi:hypothetical protein